MVRALFPVLLPFLFLLCSRAQARPNPMTDSLSVDLTSDDFRHVGPPSLLLLKQLSSNSTETCKQPYGFMPCTTTVLGNLFLVLVYGYLILVLVYGYLMFLAAKFITTGSELLLELLSPGIFGGQFLPILVALPDAVLILFTLSLALLEYENRRELHSSASMAALKHRQLQPKADRGAEALKIASSFNGRFRMPVTANQSKGGEALKIVGSFNGRFGTPGAATQSRGGAEALKIADNFNGRFRTPITATQSKGGEALKIVGNFNGRF